MTETAHLGGLRLANMSTAEAVRWIAERARDQSTCVVVTSNIHHLRLVQIDSAFADVVSRAELNVADGWPLVTATRLVSNLRLPERVAGVDLVDQVISQTRVPMRIAILGGPPGAAVALAGRVSAMHDVVLVDELPKGTWDTPSGLARLQAAVAGAAPTLTLVGIGAPRQELLADALRPALSGPAIGCGAAIEMLAGLRPRAPRLVQASRLEWAFRLALEPRRLLPRYWVAGRAFVEVVIRDAKARRGPRPPLNDR